MRKEVVTLEYYCDYCECKITEAGGRIPEIPFKEAFSLEHNNKIKFELYHTKKTGGYDSTFERDTATYQVQHICHCCLKKTLENAISKLKTFYGGLT